MVKSKGSLRVLDMKEFLGSEVKVVEPTASSEVIVLREAKVKNILA